MGDRFIEQWGPRVGPESAKNGWYATRFIATAALLTPVWGVLVAIGLGKSIDWLLILGIIVLSVAVVGFVIGIAYMVRLQRSLSQHFGHRIAFVHLPNFRESQFGDWESKYG